MKHLAPKSARACTADRRRPELPTRVLHNPTATPDPDLSALRQAFTNLRRDVGMTYDELAESTGLSRRTLLNLGAGNYHGDLRTWLVLTRALGVSMDETLSPVWHGGNGSGGPVSGL